MFHPNVFNVKYAQRELFHAKNILLLKLFPDKIPYLCGKIFVPLPGLKPPRVYACHKALTRFFFKNRIGGVMVSVLASSAVDCGFERSNQDYKTGICCFSAKHTALRRKNKDWLAWNQNNVFEWGGMSIRGLWCWSSTKQTSSSSH